MAPLIPVSFFQIESETCRPGRIVHEFFSEGKIFQPSWWGQIGIRLTNLGLLGIWLTCSIGWGSSGSWLTGPIGWGSGIGLGGDR